jgi:predicted DNA-binding WGR domain protein/cell wall assembly regulator SMI1
MKKELIYQDDKSHKFWNIETDGDLFTVTFGKVGTAGQSQTKEFDSEEKCMKEAEKLIAEKFKKGYQSNTSETFPNPTPKISESSEEPMRKIWERLEKWFEKNQPDLLEGLNQTGATNTEIEKLENDINQKLPESLKAFYKVHNGWDGCYIGFIENFLSTEDMIQNYLELGDLDGYENLYPFTTSSRARDYYAIAIDPESDKQGNVVFFSTDFKEIEDKADSFEEWIEQLVADLENGNYDDDFEMDDDEDDEDDGESMKKELIYQDDKSHKFWNIETDGDSFTVTFGKVGTAGQSQTKEFDNEEKCQKEAEKLIAEKLKKGYK